MGIGIIGAGTMGLTLAYRLTQAGEKVTVFEAAPQPGGLATWFDYGDFVWDKYYHVILKQDSSLLNLLNDLGVGDRVQWRGTKTGFLWRGRHLSMSNHWEFLTFPPLSLIDKARLAAGILRIQRINDAGPLERISASKWLSDIFGRRVYEAIWEPLVESKYGVLKDIVPATIMWATIRRYYQTRSKSDGSESMGFVGGGLKSMYDALASEIRTGGGEILCSRRVDSIEENDQRVMVTSRGERFVFDRLISTVPTSLLRKIAPEAKELFGGETGRPKFLGIILMTMILKRSLSPFYITNLIQKGYPFTGIIELSKLAGTESFSGHHVVMLPRYDVPESEWFSKSDREIAKEFVDALRPTWPDIDENLEHTFVNREKLVQALWIEAPPQAQGAAKSAGGKIWNINAELAGRDTLNNNAIVRVAEQMVKEFLALLEKQSATRTPSRRPTLVNLARHAAL